MKEVEKVCVVLIKEMDNNYRFAVLRREKDWEGWELVKGHVEKKETKEDAALKELGEEAGVPQEAIVRVEPLDYQMEWSYEKDGEEIRSKCDCFLIEVEPDTLINVKDNPDEEHSKGHFLNYRDAHDILTYENQQELLEHVKENEL